MIHISSDLKTTYYILGHDQASDAKTNENGLKIPWSLRVK